MLDKQEFTRYIKATMAELGEPDVDDEVAEEMFKQFDTNNSGNIEKDNMVTFVSQLLGKWDLQTSYKSKQQRI